MILLYHGVTDDATDRGRCSPSYMLAADAFQAHMVWLSRRCRILPLAEYISYVRARKSPPRRSVSITIDDGFASTYQVMYPLLRRLGVPATVFVSTCQPESGEMLWFAYLDALCLESEHEAVQVGDIVLWLRSQSDKQRARRVLRELALASGDPRSFCAQLAERYPLPEAGSKKYAGLTVAQLKELASSGVFEVGSHTVTHPYLSRLSPAAQLQELSGSKRYLEDAVCASVCYLAYPGGDYCRNTLDLVRKAGYAAALATIPLRLGADPLLEIPRMGVYSASLLKLKLKVLGLGALLRYLGVRLG